MGNKSKIMAILAVVAAYGFVTFLWVDDAVEGTFEERATNDVESFTRAQENGARLEFAGRDGRLYLPTGTEGGEAIAADIAEHSGEFVRDIEIVFEGDPVSQEADDKPGAEIEVNWDSTNTSGTGVVPIDSSTKLGTVLGIETLTEEDRFLTSDIEGALDTLSPSIGSDLSDGELRVSDGNTLFVRATAVDQTVIDGITSDIGDVDGVKLDLTTDAAARAQFKIDWDSDGANLTSGKVPTDLSGLASEVGVESPELDNSRVAGPDVEPTLQALQPLVGSDIVEGSVSVDDNTVVITGKAPNAAALERAKQALDGLDSVDVKVTTAAPTAGTGDVQAALDKIFELDKIKFEYRTDVPTRKTEALIDQVAEVLTEFDQVEVDIVGHTDTRGTAEANKALSDTRANAVVDALVSRDIDSSRLNAIGKGEAEPMKTPEQSENDLQENRRVEISAKETN